MPHRYTQNHAEKAPPKRESFWTLTRPPETRPFLLQVLFAVLRTIFLALLIVGFGGLGLLYGVAKTYIDTTPPLDVAQITKSNRTTYLLDMYGVEITSLSAIEYRDWANLSEIPDLMQNAVVAIEDVRFYKHSGVDFKRLVSAALEILGNSNSSGGSTLTQQLVKNKVLGSERSYKRKLQEAYLALEVERQMDKDSILEAYLNDIYLGGSNYGVKSAAKDYFGKELQDLTIRETAMIAGLTQNPYRYNPRLNMYFREEDSMDSTNARTDRVLNQLYANGYINREQFDAAMAEEVVILRESERNKMYDMAYFIEYAISDVVTHWLAADGLPDTAYNRTLYENKLRTGGYKIYTTLDPFVQQTVQDSLSTWEKYPKLADSRNAITTEAISDSVVIEIVHPQAAAVVIEQATGELRAVVGGRYEPQVRRGFNRAVQSTTEVGSAIKPLAVYAPALDMGASPATVIVNADGAVEGWGGEAGYPKGGLTDRYYGPQPIRRGIVHSLNVVAARTLFERVGIQNSIAYMTKLGIPESQLNPDGPGLALGTSGITPLQMAAAYAAIANNGYYLEPLSFTLVTDANGSVILDANRIRGGMRKVFNRASTPYLLVDMLKDAVRNGTGTRARIDGYEVAGKTGTNSDYASVYFAGMTCKYTSVLWIGHDMPSNKLEKGADGGTFAAPLWQDYMSKIMAGVESRPIVNETPASLGLVQRTVCPVSGLLATEACIAYQGEGNLFGLVTDWFDYLSVPTIYCDMHISLPICELSGLRAGSECDPTTVKNQVLVLLHPSSQFYALEDEVLYKIFKDTWRKTEKSPEVFLSEYIVCTLTESYARLILQREETIAKAMAFIGETPDLSDAHRRELLDKIGLLQNAVSYADLATTLESLKKSLREIQPMYTS
ncbi:MAG: transglycosylase domain-containing protein [Clostridiales bacterium]|nr:transglycosylase domain-containing protein [Clostridiales bacterium]